MTQNLFSIGWSRQVVSQPARLSLLIVCLALVGVRELQAAIVYDSGGFEAPKFVNTQGLAGSDPTPPPVGYGPWKKDTGTSTAVVQTTAPNGGFQSIKVTRVAASTGNTRWGINVPITPTTASNVIVIDFDLNATISAGTNWNGPEIGPLFGVECYDASGGTPKLIGSLFLDAYAGDVVYQQATNGTLQNSGTFFPRNEYHHYTLSANFTHKTYSIFVDGNMIHTEGFVDASATNFTDAPITTLAATPGSAATATGNAYFDNYTISATTSRLSYLVWQGDGVNNLWDIGNSSNWFNGDGLDVFSNNIPVVFDDTGMNTPAISLQGTLQPASVTVNATQPYTLGGSGGIGGSTSLLKRGSGALTLTGNNTYTGGTIVSNGTLTANNSTGSGTGSGAIFIGSGTTLSGTGSLGGSVTLASGATLSPGNRVGTLTINNNLTLPGDAALQFELGTTSDHLVVSGNLTLGGALNVSDAGGFGVGTYPLINYGGTLSGSGLFLASAPAGYNYALDTNTAGLVNLIVSVPPPPPAAPSGLVATSISTNQINLVWTDNSSNETRFLIERSANNFSFTEIASTPANTTTFVDTNLSPGTTFYYRIRASNFGGDSDYSAIASATTLASPPPATPDGVTATPGYGKVTVTWNAPAGATSFNLKRSTTDGGSYVTVANVAFTNYTDGGIINGTKYFYVVSAVNAGGESANSTQVSATPSGLPLAHFRFEGNTLDSSGHNNHAVPTGALTYGPGQVGANSAVFDGHSFAALPKIFETDFTVAAWVKTTSTANLPVVDGESPGISADWATSIQNGKFAFFIGTPNQTTYYTTATVNNGNWHHVAVTRQSLTGEVRLYIDGVLDTTTLASSGPRSASDDFHIGANHSPASLLFYVGSMDDVRLYGDVLPAADIALLVNPPAPALQSIGLTGGNGLPGILGNNTNVVLHGTGGIPNAQFLVLSSTNLVTSASQWTAVTTNDFDAGGNFTVTNTATTNALAEFFRLKLY